MVPSSAHTGCWMPPEQKAVTAKPCRCHNRHGIHGSALAVAAATRGSVMRNSRAVVHSAGQWRYAIPGKWAKRWFCSDNEHKHLVPVTDSVNFSTHLADDEDLGDLPLEVMNGDGNTLTLKKCLISPRTAITKLITSKTATSPTSKSERHSRRRKEDRYSRQQWRRMNTFRGDLDS